LAEIPEKLRKGSVLESLMKSTAPPHFVEQRKRIIEEIEDRIEGELISYIANPFDPLSYMMDQDCLFIKEVLRGLSKTRGSLLIESPGGDPHTAEKVLRMFRKKFNDKFEVIVIDKAKSAATMIAIGSDLILMGPSAELGPIDPQILLTFPTRYGAVQQLVPARSYEEGIEYIREKIKEGDPPEIYYPILANVRPETISMANNAIRYVKEFALTWLKRGIMKGKDKKAIERAARKLLEGYKLHNQIIDYEEAARLGLNVRLLKEDSELYDLIWKLYLHSIFFIYRINPASRLIESKNQSFSLKVEARRPPRSLEEEKERLKKH